MVEMMEIAVAAKIVSLAAFIKLEYLYSFIPQKY